MLFEIDTTEVPQLIERAYSSGNAPRYLLIKGPTDFLVDDRKIMHTISEPNIPALEPIGGTGDTITGMVSALISGGYEPMRACLIAARANRLAGQLTNPTPATPVFEMIKHIGEAVRKVADTT
jgi:NAD(P)H-hydrate repair Nnr-like enzyme with NAD(P)H-hydrate dehydratase domain